LVFSTELVLLTNVVARTMPARRANTRDSKERLGEEAIFRSMVPDSADRHDLATLLQGDCLEVIAVEEGKGATIALYSYPFRTSYSPIS
jgi:hypothetical protein